MVNKMNNMQYLNARISNLLQKRTIKNSKPIKAVISDDLRSSNRSNQALHKTMSISMIASLIKEHFFDVRAVASRIIATQRYHTLPQLVSREEIDRKVLNDNELLLFVGIRDLPKNKVHGEINATERVQQLKQGVDFLVNGILGPAIYATQAVRNPKSKDNDEEAIMHAYNQAVEYSKTNDKKGIVLRMTLKSDARTISYSEFIKLMQVNNSQIFAELQNYPGFAKYLNVFLNTPTLIAIAQGYDAIVDIPDGSVVILNRGALRIQKTNASSKNAMYAQIMIEINQQLEQEKIKKEEQLRKKREQEKKLAQQAKKIELAEKQKLLSSNNSTVKSIRSDVIQSGDIIMRMSMDENLSDIEKIEIINFANEYQLMSDVDKYVISQTLKGYL